MLQPAPKSFQTPFIPGLIYVRNFLTAQEQTDLLDIIDTRPWSNTLRRKTQHYGWRYDYTARSLDETMRLGALPDWLTVYNERLHVVSDDSMPLDQAIINEYLPGQGIASHTDCIPCFGRIIYSLSLGSAVVMDFTFADLHRCIQLEPGSLLVMRAECRYGWKHGIAARKSDEFNGATYMRDRRVSVTYRSAIIHSRS